MSDLAKIPGLRVENEHADCVEFLFEPDAGPSAAAALVSQMPNDASLWFYDSEKEPISDPGVFVTVRRREGLLWLQFKNHGWSTDWAQVPEPDVARYVWVCREDNCVGKELFYRGAGMRWKTSAPFPGTWKCDESGEIEAHVQSRIDVQCRIDGEPMR